MKTFAELQLKHPLMRAITELGYTEPTPIQVSALPVLLDKPTDFLGMAATGTGKTAAYAIPLLAALDVESNSTQALILCPTRELAGQIADNFKKLGKYLNPRVVLIYGGAGYTEQIQGLKRGAQIVIATPGRLVDHLDRGTINLSNVKTVVLDEGDKMISMGFKEDMEKILKSTQKGTSKTCQTWLFSATMQPDLRRVAERYLTKPVTVQINQKEMLSGTVKQIYYTLREDDKPEAICRILDAADNFHGLIFCQTKALVTDLTNYLRDYGFVVDELHGDKSQAEREQTYKRFRSGHIKILVCTDVAARGLDVKDLSHVVNYSLPRELESYVHRIGRTGRSGEKGIAISLVSPSHFGLVKRIEKMTGSPMTKGTIPSVDQVKAKKLRILLGKIEAAGGFEIAFNLLTDEWKAYLASKSKEEIAARFIALSYPEIMTRGGRDIGMTIDENTRGVGTGGGGGRGGYRGQGGGRRHSGGSGGYRGGERSGGGGRGPRSGGSDRPWSDKKPARRGGPGAGSRDSSGGRSQHR